MFQNFIKIIGQPNTNLFSSKNKVSEPSEVGNLLDMRPQHTFFSRQFQEKLNKIHFRFE